MIKLSKILNILFIAMTVMTITSSYSSAESTSSETQEADIPKPQAKDFYEEELPPVPEVISKESYSPTALSDIQTITAPHKYKTKFFVDVKKTHSVCKNSILCLQTYAKLNDPVSQLILGLITYNKAGDNKLQATQGVNLIKQSANAEYPYAQFILGQMYVLGAVSIPPNRKIGYSLFHEAANNDKEGDVLNTLGIYSLNEYHGVPYSINNAKSYFQKAMDLGYVDAIVNIGLIYFSGTNILPDLPKAKTYFIKACNLHYVYGCYYNALATIQENFSQNRLASEQLQVHTAKDILFAKTYTRKHHKKYVPTLAQKQAHYDYKHKFNLDKVNRIKSTKLAFQQLKDSALQGNADAIQTIIGYYMKGFEVSQDRIRGIAWAKIFNDVTYDNTLYIMTKKQSPKSYATRSEVVYKIIKKTILKNQEAQHKIDQAQEYKEMEYQKTMLVNIESALTGQDKTALRTKLETMLAKQVEDDDDQTIEALLTDDGTAYNNTDLDGVTLKVGINQNTPATTPTPGVARLKNVANEKSFIIDNNNLSTKEQALLKKSKPHSKTSHHKTIHHKTTHHKSTSKKHGHQRVCSIKAIKKLKANPNKRLLKYFCSNG